MVHLAQRATSTRSEGRTGRPWLRLRARVVRNNDVCWVRGDLVDKTLEWPHPTSPGVDHVDALSLGGAPRDRTRLRFACLGCNSSTGNGTRGKTTDTPTTSRPW